MLLVALLIFAILRAVRLLPARAVLAVVNWTPVTAVLALAVYLSLPALSGAVFGPQATGLVSPDGKKPLLFAGPFGLFLPACLAIGILAYLTYTGCLVVFSLGRGIVFVLVPLLAFTFGTNLLRVRASGRVPREPNGVGLPGTSVRRPPESCG